MDTEQKSVGKERKDEAGEEGVRKREREEEKREGKKITGGQATKEWSAHYADIPMVRYPSVAIHLL